MTPPGFFGTTASHELTPGDVHLWHVPLDVLGGHAMKFAKRCISSDEWARATRFRSPRDRERFITSRIALRHILAEYICAHPNEIEFLYSPTGKPRLKGNELQFNLTHSYEHAVVAVSASFRVGVDLEQVRHLPDLESLASIPLTAKALAAFNKKQAASAQLGLFFRIWTAYEARCKATGEGIGKATIHDLLDELCHDWTAVPKLLNTKDGWWLAGLSPSEGYYLAVALNAPITALHCSDWQPAWLGKHQRFEMSP